MNKFMKSQNKNEVRYLLKVYDAVEYTWMDNHCQFIDVVFDTCIIRYLGLDGLEDVFYVNGSCQFRRHQAIGVVQGGYAGED